MPNYRRVTLAIEEQILGGRMKLGDPLPTEQDLAEQLGVNRSTLREGLRALENAGLVKRAGGKKLIDCASNALPFSNTDPASRSAASLCPMASSTGEAFTLPDEQAEPALTITPRRNAGLSPQFTSEDWLKVLKATGCRISMDGKGRWIDNVFIERLWRSGKYEEVYLRAYESVGEARNSIGRYLEFYNSRRPHSSLDGSTPDQAYFNSLPIRLAA